MIVPMKKYAFLVHHSDYENFLNGLRQLGVLHVRQREVTPSEKLISAIQLQKSIREVLHEFRQRAGKKEGSSELSASEGLDMIAAYRELTQELENHQQLVLAAAEILIEIYMAEGAILKAEKVAARVSDKQAEGQIAMAKLNLHNAVNTIGEKGREAIAYFSEGDEQRMMLMGLKRFTKYTNTPNPIAWRKTIARLVIDQNKYCF